MSVNPVIERARRHAAQLKQVQVPEWGDEDGEPFIIYSEAVKATVYNKCRQLATDGSGYFDQVKFAAMIVASCAMTSERVRMFEDHHWSDLLESADADTITRVGTLLVASDKRGLQALEKN